MDLSKVKKQEGDMWVDGNDQSVPTKYLTPYQKLEERKVNTIFNIAKTAYEQLKKKKIAMAKIAEELIKTYIEENSLELDQNSFTFYNFDRSVQFEVDKPTILEYDINLITQASQYFKKYLNAEMENINPALKELIEKMILNVQKENMNINTVKKLKDLGRKVDHPDMVEAVNLIDSAQKEGLSRIYYRVRFKNPETLKYDLLDINFSAIEI